MDLNEAFVKIQDCVPQIFGYALKRTDNRQEAEDLSQEILTALCASVSTLREESKFYAWMWAVANNVFKGYLRRKQRHHQYGLPEQVPAPLAERPEELLVSKEQLGLLYREISLLAGLYREATVLYYIQGKSCDEIAAQLEISVDMVKQYLFKSRKKVREGMEAIRERGERSFNPKRFKVYFWGRGGNSRAELFTRKLPGNIMQEAYYEPVTVEQLSLELGVAAVYLEDEIKILLKHDLLRQAHNNRYQSNIVIFTNEFETELHNLHREAYTSLAGYLHGFLLENEADIRQASFRDNQLSRNSLFWQMATLTLVEAATERLLAEKASQYPSLSDGMEGFVWGLERYWGDNSFDFGIHSYTSTCGSQIKLVDYFILEKQHYPISNKRNGEILFKVARGQSATLSESETEDLSLLIQEGYVRFSEGELKLACPVLTIQEYRKVREILQPAIDRVYQTCSDMLPITSKLLNNHVPAALREQVPVLTALKQVEDCISRTMNEMYLCRFIEVPRPLDELLTVYVVLT